MFSRTNLARKGLTSLLVKEATGGLSWKLKDLSTCLKVATTLEKDLQPQHIIGSSCHWLQQQH